MLRPQPACARVLLDRYAACGEHDAAQVYARVAVALAQAETPARRASAAKAFLLNMQRGAIGAGRIMANAGTEARATMVNCFVQPVGGPQASLSFQAGLQQALETLAMGGGVGYDFSALPPLAASPRGRATAPSVREAIDQYDDACARLAFEGSRRGAQMAVLSCAHPDILDFVQAKHGRRRWRTFNISVAVSDAFLAAVQRDESWPLVHHAPPGKTALDAGAFQRTDGLWQYRQDSARHLWDAIAREAVHSAEPGLLFIDTIARTNNLRALETIRATNPCGEQPLPDYGCCVLGPINLTRLVEHPFGLGGPATVNFGTLASMVSTQVRMLDNVLELTHWPLAAQQAQAMATRRIGVGVTGLADMLAMLQLRYDSDAGRQAASKVARCIRDSAYAASAALARERGPFPLYRPADYLSDGGVGDAIAAEVRDAVRRHGLRNSHLVSYAPTGSVSLAFADNCSSGIEPAFGWTYRRRVMLRAATVDVPIENHAWRQWNLLSPRMPLPAYFRTADQIAPEDHVAMVGVLQPFVDAAISKTVPVPSDCSVDRAQALFMTAFRLGLKGITLFRPDPGLAAVLGKATGVANGPAPPSACEGCA
ncbi:adenosylcobalamin-dependent ribonucleoside-diphosphate reductase [Achromobacter mucicolens]|uniref:adenosylcobalamin-dependent ribonucleoside-diphosphate reductase n=1 Tax=Achromobacter mucicolens TaxID=1389922 RepID=UPI000D3C2C97|nr:adenosylcobalamin-dependent ribonucleoside-diphosphate reductase [Achromobacter mucicolens]PTX10627.1 adenosylcobalamin-dependent ribonucleoside-diphosphate reductase [Achromobacter mucicolens]